MLLGLSRLVFLTLSSTSLCLSQESFSFCGLPSTAVANAPATSLYPDGSAYKLSLSLLGCFFPIHTHTRILSVCVCRKRKKGAVLTGLVIDRLEANQSASTANLQPENLGWPMEGDPKRGGISTLEAPPSSFAATYTHAHPLYMLPLHPTEHRPASGPLVHWEFQLFLKK